ncbi:MAG: biotin/lipoate A/B protein ligase family protein [Candidatus Omnitrophica bacterium]|nr:biotin/lipoate A/B protein ligase family protein [Candidatus Omnitrophota bacterium]MDD5573753.1 biotin/lipoate A/B protein ligase family protein [Candidatus Omnitrophota bacterium]
MTTFRLIESGYGDAATNMAVDEALFLGYNRHICLPTLRIYGWETPAFSIGYSQDPRAILHLERMKEKKVPLVRRPTGGGALFHDDELTYSIIVDASDFNATRSIRDSFEKTTGVLIEAYRILGIKAAFSKTKPLQPHTIEEFCFARKEEYDIVAAGKKIGGNAQRRRRGTVLQHGSIPLAYDARKAAVFLLHPEVLNDLKIATVGELTGKKITFHRMAEILIAAFTAYLPGRAVRTPLSPQEQALVRNLKETKYANPEWNLKKKPS